MADQTPVQQPSQDPRRLGRYELLAEIARGGMGTVLLARLAGAGGFQRLFAIKLLHEHFAGDTEFVEMLLDEARIAALIHHPNVVSIQEVLESEQHGYHLVMDYVEGFPLSHVWHSMDLPAPVRWRIMNRIVLDALQGLGAAHGLVDDEGQSLHVVHRDMSPQNILVGVDGIARVVDFGIAKAAARISSTRAGQVKGKLAYMAPEQARGMRVDQRTDLFAMGTVLWESLTGQRLFKAASDAETFHRLAKAPIPHARDVDPTVPVELDAVCARALERDVNLRFGSALAMGQALELAARARGLLADAHEVGDWVRRNFSQELSLRRAAVRAAGGAQTTAPRHGVALLPGGLVVPQLGDPTARASSPGSGVPAATGSQCVAAGDARNSYVGAGAPRPSGPPPPPLEETQDDPLSDMSTAIDRSSFTALRAYTAARASRPPPVASAVYDSQPTDRVSSPRHAQAHAPASPADALYYGAASVPPLALTSTTPPHGAAWWTAPRAQRWVIASLVAVGLTAGLLALVLALQLMHEEAPRGPAAPPSTTQRPPPRS